MSLPASLLTYTPRLRLRIERERDQVKTVETKEELEEVLRLRHRVYRGELAGKPTKVAGLEHDAFDALCDHMMILENKTSRVIGTYRLNASVFNRRFYSEKEFHLKNILALPGGKLEIGRACIDSAFRSGGVFSLLWRGILAYFEKISARYLFGCSSVPLASGLSPAIQSAAVYQWLSAKYLSAAPLRIKPRFFHRVPFFKTALRSFKNTSDEELEKEMVRRWTGDTDGKVVTKGSRGEKIPEQKMDFPSPTKLRDLVSELLLFYLRAGAVICGPPAFDREFRCFDFFTLLDMQRVGDQTRGHFHIPLVGQE